MIVVTQKINNIMKQPATQYAKLDDIDYSKGKAIAKFTAADFIRHHLDAYPLFCQHM